MLIQIVSLILNVAIGLVAGACLLRLYMQWTGAPFYNPIGQMVLTLTNWLVLPIRRLVPAFGKLDTSSLVAAFLLKLAHNLIFSMLLGGLAGAPTPLLVTFALSIFDLASLALSLATAILLASVITSWLRVEPSIGLMLRKLSDPMLEPLRRLLPAMGGLDLSPLIAIVIIQVLSIILRYLQAASLLPLVVG